MRFQRPPPRTAHRVGDLFGGDGHAGQTQDMIDNAVERVFDFLPNKPDQRALTFVDKGTRALLLPKLYHTVTIDIADYPYNLIAVTNLFDVDNPGRDFIKHVIFDGSNVDDKSSPPSGYTHLASLAIENLPLYQLEHFEWPADFELPAMYTLRLMDRQDTLKNVALYNNTLSIRPDERKSTLDALTELESLRLSPDNKAGLRFISHIIKTHQLKDLHVDLRTYAPRQRDTDYSQPQPPESDICEMLFQYSTPLHKCPIKLQLPLTRLTLWKANLYRSAETWFKVLRPMYLRELELDDCTWAGNLLAVLGTTQPMLTKVKVVHSPNDDQMDKAPANKKHGLTIDNAVRLFLKDLADAKAKVEAPSLQSLVISLLDAGDYIFFGNGALAAHTPKLEVMAVDFPPLGTALGDLPGLAEALEACDVLRLRQLAVPALVLSELEAPLFHSINPVTLTLVQRLEGKHEARPQEVADHALAVLRATHKEKTRLRVVAVDSSGGGGGGGGAWGTIDYFVRCEVDVLGRKEAVMVSAQYDEIKKFEREIDILSYGPSSFALGEGRV